MKLAPMPVNYAPSLPHRTNWKAYEEAMQLFSAFSACDQSRMQVVDNDASKPALVRRLASYRSTLVHNGYPQFGNIRVRHDTKADMVYLEKVVERK